MNNCMFCNQPDELITALYNNRIIAVHPECAEQNADYELRYACKCCGEVKPDVEHGLCDACKFRE